MLVAAPRQLCSPVVSLFPKSVYHGDAEGTERASAPVTCAWSNAGLSANGTMKFYQRIRTALIVFCLAAELGALNMRSLHLGRERSEPQFAPGEKCRSGHCKRLCASTSKSSARAVFKAFYLRFDDLLEAGENVGTQLCRLAPSKFGESGRRARR